MTKAARKVEHPAAATLRGALYTLERSQKMTPELYKALGDAIRTATDMVLRPDPLTERTNFVILALRQSSSYTAKMVRGKLIERVSVNDLSLYNWAMSQIHTVLGHP